MVAPHPEALQEALSAVLGSDGTPSPDKVRAALRRLPRKLLGQVNALIGHTPEPFDSYLGRVSPKFIKMRWLEPVIAQLQLLVDGEIDRLIIEAPPRHGKSFVVSEHLPAYFLHRYPWRWVGLASHSSALALGFSRRARQNFMRGGGKLHPTARAVQRWQTDEGDGEGGMWARGFDSGITGEGSGLLVIDDPVKSRKAIKTPEARRQLGETYRDVLYTRLEADAGLVLMATRWHKHDLTGQMLEAEGDVLELSEGWVLISRPAIARQPDDVRRDIPASVRVIADTREPGEALAPERGYDETKLKAIKKVVGPSTWGSLFQQDPRPMDGAMFKWTDLPSIDATHSVGFRVRYWDLAISEGEGDFTAGGLVSYQPDSKVPVIIEDVQAEQFGPARRDHLILETARADAAKYGADGFIIYIESLGKDDTKALVAKLGGFIVKTESASGQGSKEIRAAPLASQAQVGNVALLTGSWNDRFREQACAFPNGDHDDEVDAVSGAYNRALDLAMSHAGFEDEFQLV